MDVSIKVSFFVDQDLEVGSKHSWCIQGFESELLFWWPIVFGNDIKYKSQNQKKCRVNTFDSARVEVEVREFLFTSLFDDDAWNEVPWDDEENIDSDESSDHKFWESMKYNNNKYCYSSQTVNVRPVRNRWVSLFRLFLLLNYLVFNSKLILSILNLLRILILMDLRHLF